MPGPWGGWALCHSALALAGRRVHMEPVCSCLEQSEPLSRHVVKHKPWGSFRAAAECYSEGQGWSHSIKAAPGKERLRAQAKALLFLSEDKQPEVVYRLRRGSGPDDYFHLLCE